MTGPRSSACTSVATRIAGRSNAVSYALSGERSPRSRRPLSCRPRARGDPYCVTAETGTEPVPRQQSNPVVMDPGSRSHTLVVRDDSGVCRAITDGRYSETACHQRRFVRVVDLLQPFHGLTVQRFLDGDVAHCGRGARVVPVLLARSRIRMSGCTCHREIARLAISRPAARSQ